MRLAPEWQDTADGTRRTQESVAGMLLRGGSCVLILSVTA